MRHGAAEIAAVLRSMLHGAALKHGWTLGVGRMLSCRIAVVTDVHLLVVGG
jgi:hypothetical protein